MKTYTITLTASIEAENKKEALENFMDLGLAELNNGENIEIEKEIKEERYCVKCGKTIDLIEGEDMCYSCAKKRNRI
jgi:rRNA maturation endonuclease Nob1